MRPQVAIPPKQLEGSLGLQLFNVKPWLQDVGAKLHVLVPLNVTLCRMADGGEEVSDVNVRPLTRLQSLAAEDANTLVLLSP